MCPSLCIGHWLVNCKTTVLSLHQTLKMFDSRALPVKMDENPDFSTTRNSSSHLWNISEILQTGRDFGKVNKHLLMSYLERHSLQHPVCLPGLIPFPVPGRRGLKTLLEFTSLVLTHPQRGRSCFHSLHCEETEVHGTNDLAKE